MSYEYFYSGSQYSLAPDSGNFFTGYRMKMGEFGLAMDPRTANQLQEVSNKLNTGLKSVEVGNVQADIFESIPQQHMKEINRLSKLTGISTTMHAPLIEASGYQREGWSEIGRQQAERQMKLAMERAHDLSPDGGMPVTFHSTAMLPEMEAKVMEKVEGEKKLVSKEFYIVDPRTGAMLNPLKPTERFFPGDIGEGGKQKPFNPEEELKRINKDQWSQTLGNISFSAIRGEGEIERLEGLPEVFEKYADVRKHPEKMQEVPEDIRPALERGFKQLDHASIFLKDAYRGLKEMYNMAYKEASEEDKKKLNAYAESVKDKVAGGIEANPEKMQEFAAVIQDGVKVLNSMTPSIYKPMKEFVMDKSSTTFGNVAFESWKTYKSNAPIVSIENPPAGGGLSTAEDLKRLVEDSRAKFVEQAKKEGYSESEAKDAANKMIGVTWDVGHINMLRKMGYEKEDLIKQAEIIKPFLNKIHLSDNFGMEHTELPMGMGNVPIKEIMEKLGKEGYDAKKVIEAGNWWQHFSQQGKVPPVMATLEAFGSPVYPMLAQPYWNQAANTYGNYFAFPSAYMPEQHFSLYGGGFSSLPQELGGQIPGKQSRMTGTPMD